MPETGPDVDDELGAHLRAALTPAHATAPVGDPLPGVLTRARRIRRRRRAAGAVAGALAVAGVAALAVDVAGHPAAAPQVAAVPTQSPTTPAATEPPTGTPTPTSTGPSATPTGGTTAAPPSTIASATPPASAADVGRLLLRPADLPANPYNDGPPRLDWQQAAATGPGRCLAGHLPASLRPVGGTDLVAPSLTAGSNPTFRYRQAVLDAGSPASAVQALAALRDRLSGCGTHHLAGQPVGRLGGEAAWVTWTPDPTAATAPAVSGSAIRSDSRDDEYVAVDVAGRYLLTLSFEVHENGNADLAHAVGDPLERAAARGR